ncbi:MAG: hypothetical protein ACRYFV_01640 [Janthinobacterium lividum]
MIYASYYQRHFWIRFGKVVFTIKDVRRWPLLFSQRMGKHPCFQLGNYFFGVRRHEY